MWKKLKKAAGWVWKNKGKVIEVVVDLYEKWKNRKEKP